MVDACACTTRPRRPIRWGGGWLLAGIVCLPDAAPAAAQSHGPFTREAIVAAAATLDSASHEPPAPATAAADVPSHERSSDGYPLGTAFQQVLGFTTFQHLVRLHEPRTRGELGGPFFRDWFTSVANAGRTWDDGGKVFTNYVAHPMGGAVYAHIYRQNDPRRSELAFGEPGYGGTLLRAMAFSAVASTQFELGPLSEASIGNVGLRNPQAMAWVDLVVTPTIGTAWMAGEDALDKYLLKRMDGGNVYLRNTVRFFANPSRSGANLSRGKWPWYRTRDSDRAGRAP